MSSADPLIGRLIAGKMELLEVLGSGAMGKVYRARHRGLDKIVAIKVLHPEVSSSASIAARFKAEARAASKLDHPHSLSILDFGEDGSDRLLYLAMELLEGESLQSLLSRHRRLPAARAARIMAQVCSALGAAHERGVIHRDVKPANVMLTSRRGDEGPVEDHVKVCDFGLAKVLDTGAENSSSGPLTQQGAVLGTPAYMAPEQAKGETVDHRSDLYACGVILYRMLAGKKPFEGESAWAVSLKQIAESPQPIQELVPEIPEALARVVHRALEKDPAQRFQSAREMRAELLDAVGIALDSQDGSAEEVDPTFVREATLDLSQALGRRQKRRALWVAGGLAFAVAATTALFVDRPPPLEATPLPIEKPIVEKPAEPQEVALSIAGAPEGTRVLVNGVLLGRLPADLTLAKGERSLTLRFEADGHEALERTVLPSRDIQLTIALRRLEPIQTKPPRDPPKKTKKADRHSLENPFE
jgi:tRNA A-37 threonylcarbamoyl transferase component Bud32